MNREIISASGERAALGGYLPQFDEFSWFAYLNLINNELEWIRIADPTAEKLDDIQYSTHSQIHAYQVKWTISNANISFANFIELIPLISSSWKNLKSANSSKRVIPHLITNKPASSHDSVKNGEIKVGSFADFLREAWIKIKSNQLVDDKWKPILAELKTKSNLNDSEFEEFVICFDFQPDYKQKQFSIGNVKYSKEEDDLQKISRFIVEKVASPERVIELTRQEIIKELGWSDRFKTIFNHELIVDRKRYQPIQSTIDMLNSRLVEHKNGYLFLLGGPGSGKSTLLNQWSKSIKERIIRYYAFDFVNPSSHLNFYERGNATHLFFDLVFQLREAGIYKRDILPYKDLLFLKDVFNEQLRAIGEDFVTNGQPTIILIDGLDHVPREYKSTSNTFLRELPLPSSLPNGVFIVLGSQSYELEDIQQEIKTEFQKGNRTITIDSLRKEEVYKYIDNLDCSIQFDGSQKLKIFEKSQGHPLYLSYLIEKINSAESINETIKSFEVIDGSIDNYYKKIWEPIQKEDSQIQFLGLIARINGSINFQFIQEWDFQPSVLKSFREKARFLFNATERSLTFFHNSFKQFLLHQTSLNYLTDEFDSTINVNYHDQLADYYVKSEIEKYWKKSHHLFQAHRYDRFISEVTPESFAEQLLEFRPAEDIKQDAKLGVEIARQNKDIITLVRYLFSLAEIERRLFNIDPVSFTEELLSLNKFDLAKDYLRTGNTLHCSESYALRACRHFIKFGRKSEGATLYNLAYPEIIADAGIIIDDYHNYDEIKDSLEEWAYTSPYFETTEYILAVIESIQFTHSMQENRHEERENDFFQGLLSNLGHSLIDQNRWDDFNKITKKIDLSYQHGRNSLFQTLEYAIEHSLDLNDSSRAKEYLSIITTYFTREKTTSIGKIFIADLIYKVTRDLIETFSWIEEVEQPFNVGEDLLGYDDSLDTFLPLIKLNKLLNLCGKGVSITTAIPSVAKGTDEEILVEFERMLCITTQILSEGVQQTLVSDDIIKRVFPIVRFYYKEISPKNRYWYKLTKSKGQFFDFLIFSVSEFGSTKLELLGDYFFSEFQKSSKYWSTSVRRKIIRSLLNYGFDIEKAKIQLGLLADSMLENHDIDGRITECLEHARVFFVLRNLEEGEKWLKQAIQESIGVGYRKDYQFSTWIEWLRRINRKDPSKASERIKWFLSHLNHIKETTEGRAYWNASEELLEVAFEHNLNDGLEQTIWQLENDLIDFKDSIALFIKYFIKRVTRKEEFESLVELYCDLFLILAESTNSSLLKYILEKGYEIVEEDFLKEYIQRIILAIEVNAYEDSRHNLLSEIKVFFASKGLRIEDFYSGFKIPVKNERDSPTTSHNTLVLKTNNRQIDENEVLQRVNSYDDFIKIIQEEDSANSFFDWSKVIEKITLLLSSSQIEEVVKVASFGRRESDFYAKLSEAALKLGNVELATSLANKSIELSGESGWVKYYDGGTRINAFNALKQVNSEISSNKAFEVFAHDILSSNYPSSYIEHLDDIIPLLTENYIEENLWPEIYNYLQRLMSNSKPVEALPILSSLKRPIMETLVDYIIYLSQSPVSIIKDHSLQLLAKYINRGNDYALTQLLNGCIDEYSCMDVIMTLFMSNSPQVHALKSKIKSLALSNDHQLRNSSKQILSSLTHEIPTFQKIILPKIYSLHIPEIGKPDFKKEIDPYFPEVDINDPRDLITPFEFLIKILSEESGMDESNLIYRAYSIMKRIGREEEWTVEYEKKLRFHLEEINLKYSYPRPRVIAARKAIMHVASELIDSGIINGQRIQRAFTSHDYAVQFFDIIAKPEFIQTLKEREFGGVGNDWLERISDSSRMTESLLDYNDGFKIVAEYTKVRNLDWGAPTEKYMYQIAGEEHMNEKENYIFGSAFHQLSEDYHSLKCGGHFIVVIRDHRFNQFDLKTKWIAINPVLCRHLEWEPELSKLFAWKNSQGKLMAESIYWSNGNIGMTPREDGEVGEGWFVVVSKDGLEQIKSVEKNLFFQKKLTRSTYKNSLISSISVFKNEKI